MKVLARESTPLGLLLLRQRRLPAQPETVVTEMTLNHELLMSSHVTASERALARRALEMHTGSDLRILVGGLGLGYTAHEAIVAGGDRVAQVEVVEYLPQVIGWVARGLVPLARDLENEERLQIVQGDVYERLMLPSTRKHDIILIDVDNSPDMQLGSTSAEFYTVRGLKKAQQHLAEGGILAVWSHAAHAAFVRTLGKVFGSIHVEAVTTQNELAGEQQTDWLFFACG